MGEVAPSDQLDSVMQKLFQRLSNGAAKAGFKTILYAWQMHNWNWKCFFRPKGRLRIAAQRFVRWRGAAERDRRRAARADRRATKKRLGIALARGVRRAMPSAAASSHCTANRDARDRRRQPFAGLRNRSRQTPCAAGRAEHRMADGTRSVPATSHPVNGYDAELACATATEMAVAPARANLPCALLTLRLAARHPAPPTFWQ